LNNKKNKNGSKYGLKLANRKKKNPNPNCFILLISLNDAKSKEEHTIITKESN